MTVQPVLCRTWSEIQIVGFLMHRLKYNPEKDIGQEDEYSLEECHGPAPDFVIDMMEWEDKTMVLVTEEPQENEEDPESELFVNFGEIGETRKDTNQTYREVMAKEKVPVKKERHVLNQSKTEKNVDLIMSLMNKYKRYSDTSLYEAIKDRYYKTEDEEAKQDRQTIKTLWVHPQKSSCSKMQPSPIN